MPPSGVDYASRFLNGYAPEYVGMCFDYKLQDMKTYDDW